MGTNNSLITDDRSRNRRSHAASRRTVALREGGFTLAELLIATGITAIIVVTLGWMLGSLMNSATHTTQRVDAFRDARAALQMMERDMANLVQLPATSPPLMAAAYFALADSYSDPNTATPKNQQLYALCATKNQLAVAGDVCAVGYYCRWDTNHYVLCRYLRPWNSGGSPTMWQTFQTYQSSGYAPASALYTPNSTGADEVLAAYVWNFGVTMYKSDGTVISSYPYICDPNVITNNPLPAAIEISFNAMSPQAARTVTSVSSSPNDWMDTTSANYQRLILPHMYQFRTRINFQ
jgi:type II secretory pathway pseudopilin PulG